MKSLLRMKFQGWAQRLDWFRAGRFWGRQHGGHCEDWSFWLAIDPVMHWVNRRVSGEERIWPLSWFLLSLPKDKLPVRQALSIGCGTGSLEREVIRLEAARRITGIDISEASLKLARESARKAGYAERIAYGLFDAESWLSNPDARGPVDLIFFHASLHHIKSLEKVLELCAHALRQCDPGLLYLDEYVGPSRDEWNEGHLGFAAALFEHVPFEFRRFTQLRPPVAYGDPTEMARSSEIEEVVRSKFEIVEYKPYYGNVVMPLVSGISPNGLTDPRVHALLAEAMELEDYLIERELIEPMHAVIVGRPLQALGESRSASEFRSFLEPTIPPTSKAAP